MSRISDLDRPTVRINAPLDCPVGGGQESDPPIGEDYRIERTLGRGGMGIVHLAVQKSVGRLVAIKSLTNFHNGDPESLARFQAEAETLSILDHPGIVRVLETGTRNDAPFLVMEYLSGGSLADRIRTDRPTEREALKLLIAVARAVDYAHQNGVIHRDLKPANILMTEEGRPKVADFGLALTADNPRLTQTGKVAGTPPYMAPEQLTGSKVVTPAVDIYALGVIMHELLTGVVPFAGSAPLEILTQISGRGALPLRVWKPGISAHLDTICRKCLEFQANQRYRSAAEFADDLQRYMEGRSIRARAVGPVKHLWRWCRRNRGIAVMGATAVTALIAATIISSISALEANRQWRRAANAVHEREVALKSEQQALRLAEQSRATAETAAQEQQVARNEAERVADRMCRIFEGFEPDQTDMLTNLRRELLDAARDFSEDGGDSLTTARLQFVLGHTLNGTGDFRHALPLLENAYRLRSRKLGPEHHDTLKAAKDLAFAKLNHNQLDEASALLEQTLEIRRRLQGDSHVDCLYLLNDIGLVHRRAGRHDVAHAHFNELLSARIQKLGHGDPRTQLSAANVAVQLDHLGQSENALPILEQALAANENRHGKSARESLWIAQNYGAILTTTGRTDDAIRVLEDVFNRKKTIFGVNHHELTATIELLARAYGRHYQLKASEAGAVDERDTATVLSDFARMLEARRDYYRLIPVRETILEIRTTTCGPNASETLWAVHNLGFAYEFGGLVGRAVPLYQRAFQGLSALRGPNHEDTILMQSRLGSALRQTRRNQEARPILEDAWRKQTKWESETKGERKLGVWLPREYGLALSALGEDSAAEELLRESMKRSQRMHGAGSTMSIRAGIFLGRHLLQCGQVTEAEKLLATGADFTRRMESNRWETYEVLSFWGAALGRLSMPDAEKQLKAGYTGLKDRSALIPPMDRTIVLAESAKRLADFYATAGKPEEAEKWNRVASAGP